MKKELALLGAVAGAVGVWWAYSRSRSSGSAAKHSSTKPSSSSLSSSAPQDEPASSEAEAGEVARELVAAPQVSGLPDGGSVASGASAQFDFAAEASRGTESTAPEGAKKLSDSVWKLEEEDRYTTKDGREVDEMEIAEILKKDAKPIPEFWRNKYENEARRMWDVFYRVNKNKFFKDRHYLDKEWSDLKEGEPNVFEVGCGVGNTVLPLLQVNPKLKVWCCDFSDNAIDILRSMEGYDANRCTSFVADLTKDPLVNHTGEGAMDIVMMIFVLSAINPDKMLHCLQTIAATMKPGARLLFRDYGLYDMAQLKMAEPKGHKISDNFYVRKDGTRAYYFTESEVRQLFSEAGFEEESLSMHKRLVVNRKEGKSMHRRWVHGTFVKNAGVVSL